VAEADSTLVPAGMAHHGPLLPFSPMAGGGGMAAGGGWYHCHPLIQHAFSHILQHRFWHILEHHMETEDKVRENRLRRMADRQGLRLVKSRTRDPRGVDYGLYALLDHQTGGAVNPALADRWVCSWDLDAVEAYLTH
jgi:hypothetical protein